MNIRLIAGSYGGRLIKAPEGKTTHPMGERVRGALFNILGDRVKDARVLDAFSGTGAIGLEAISRGARQVTFIEKDKTAGEILRGNITSIGVENSTTTFIVDVDVWIRKNQGDYYDIVFADPPYDNVQLSTVSKLCGLLKPKGLMVLSYPGRSGVPQVNGFVVVDDRSYGNASLVFYQRE